MPRFEPGFSRPIPGPRGGAHRPSRAQVAFARAVVDVFAQTSFEMRKFIFESRAKGLAQQLAEADRQLNKQQRFVREALRTKAFPPGLRRQMHEDIGRAAQASVVAAYTHRRYRRGTAPYRMNPRRQTNVRYANGALQRALEAGDFFEATADRLRFINITRLNIEAVHWRRLNFGAGSAAGDPPGRFEWSWGNFVAQAIGLEPDPRPAFALPAGYWFGPGATGRVSGVTEGAEFYPRGEAPPGNWGRPTRRRMTRGIAASNFLDAGVRRIAEEYPRALSTMTERAFRNPALRQRVESKAGVPIPRPMPQRFKARRLR